MASTSASGDVKPCGSVDETTAATANVDGIRSDGDADVAMTDTNGVATESSPQSQPQRHPLQGVAATLGSTIASKIASCKVLLVGSGGIGCELLKNLALSGFRRVHVIDLDTVDVSNLNRQFLFRSVHVGMPKCTVATEAAKRMVPSPLTIDGIDNGQAANNEKDPTSDSPGASADSKLEYVAHHGNVKDNDRFGVKFFKSFDVVLNALDNVDARRHVNRLCLASNVPLVEAGTTGYLGQVTVISKEGNVECYECQPKPTQKVYPICTIRSTPSQPVHTIVWAKELYKLLFNEKPELSMLYEGGEEEQSDGNSGVAASTGLKEDGSGGTEKKDNEYDGTSSSVYMDVVLNRPISTQEEQKKSPDEKASETGKSKKPNYDRVAKIRDYAHAVLEALFVKEIEKQLQMDRYKTAKKKPTPLEGTVLQEGVHKTVAPTRGKAEENKSTDVWTPAQCIAEFVACLEDAYEERRTSPVIGEFDKDDALAMRLVTSASNLRSFQFGIEMQSMYEAKGIAGNIIPAIATTNAIVAGLQLLQVFKILELAESDTSAPSAASVSTANKSVKESCRYVYCQRSKNRKGYYLQPTKLADPNPNCFVCRHANVDVCIDTLSWSLKDFVEKVIKKRLGFAEPSIMIGDSQIHEEGEGADTDMYSVNLEKKLINLPCGGMKDGTIVRVEDFSQDLEVDLCISHRSEWDEKEEPDGFTIGGNKPKAAPLAAAAAAKPVSEEAASGDNSAVAVAAAGTVMPADNSNDDEVVILDTAGEDTDRKPAASAVPNTKKRRAQPGSLDDVDAKKKKTRSNEDVVVILS